MTIFNDIALGFDNYPADECVITITDLTLVSGTTSGPLNVNETWKFKVNVENTGHINMTSVVLHVEGWNGAHVSATDLGPTGSWTDTSIVTGSLTVNGGGSQKSNFIFFRTPVSQRVAGTKLVSAHISDWNGNWDHMFSNHTNHASVPEAVYSNQVFP